MATGSRHLISTLLLLLGFILLPDLAIAQKNCTKGKPCGNSCIARNKTCRIGTGSARSAPTVAAPRRAVTPPADAQYVASSRGRVFYFVGCSAWKNLSSSNLRFFKTRQEAESAGYTPSQSSGCAGPKQPTTQTSMAGAICTVQRVVDGDTIRCEEGAETVRLLLIDAPELDQGPYGSRARDALAALIPAGTRTTLEPDLELRDRYGRLLGYVHLSDGRMVNEEILRQGYGVVSVYPPNVKHVDSFRIAAEEAQGARRGLWEQEAFSSLPEDYRAGKC